MKFQKTNVRDERVKLLATLLLVFIFFTFLVPALHACAMNSKEEKNEEVASTVSTPIVYELTVSINDSDDEVQNYIMAYRTEISTSIPPTPVKKISRKNEEILLDDPSDIDPLEFYSNRPIYERYGITEREFNILCDLTWHEYGYGCVEGQAAVVSVVLNRVNSEHFPNDIESVVAQKGQFSQDYVCAPFHEPTEKMLEAFEIAFSEKDYSNGGFFYCNLETSDPENVKWFKNLTVTAEFDGHTFFKMKN